MNENPVDPDEVEDEHVTDPLVGDEDVELENEPVVDEDD